MTTASKCAARRRIRIRVAHAAHYIAEQQHYGFGQLPVCTVIGFPNGYVPSGIKCMEAESAVADGATEIDMVINLGWVKEGQYDKILQEINSVKISCHGNHSQGHHRDLYAHGRGEDQALRGRVQLRGGLYQDLHRLRRGGATREM